MSEFNPRPKEEMPPKKEKKPIKRTRIKYKRKDHVMKDVFTEIAAEREWKCFVTGQTLYQLKDTQFLHVLPKALNKFPLFRAYKSNIVLASDDIHFAWDFWPKSEILMDERFNKLRELEESLIHEYKLYKSGEWKNHPELKELYEFGMKNEKK